MSGKREASYTIDPHTLEEKDKHQDPPSQSQNPSDTSKSQRIIFKIKRPGQNPSENPETKVTFQLNQSQQIKPSSEQQNPPKENDKEVINPFANLFKADKNIFNGIGIFSNNNSTNLFTSNKGTEQSASTQANSTVANNIFSTNGSSANSKSLFNNGGNALKGTASSLFQQNAPPIPAAAVISQANNDDDGSGDSAQLEEAQNLRSDPSKSTKNYNYDDSCPVLLTLKASKFKKAGSDLIENVQIVLQKQKQTSIKYITVRLPLTKKSIFSGILVEKKSEVKNINGKKQNVQVNAFTKEKEGFAKIALKFQFQKEEDGAKLFERLSELLSGKEVGTAEDKKQ